MQTSNAGILHGKVAVVTGASRGLGRGVAMVLGERGATVYVTGRTTDGDKGTIGETAELVTARGGKGIAVQVDHTKDDQVEALFGQVREEHGKLDILVNNVWGGYENFDNYGAPFWDQPIWRWDKMFNTGSRAHFVASKFAAPLMMGNGGLIVNTSYPDSKWRESDRVHIVNVVKGAVNDLTRVMAKQLFPHKVCVVSVAPAGHVVGIKRMAKVYDALKTPGGIEALYNAEPPDGETWEYGGLAVAAIAEDPERMKWTGKVLAVDKLADEYGFTDIDGRVPRLCY